MTLLGDLLIEAKPGFACGKEDPEGIFQFRMNNVTGNSELSLTKRRRVPVDAVRKIDDFRLKPGDVLFNATNSPDGVGKSVFLPELDEPAVFSNHFLRLRPIAGKLDARYLWRWLQLQHGRGVFQSMCKQWVNQATVGRQSLLAIPVEVPPIEEQRRIAAILDQADAVRAKRRQVLAHFESIPGAWLGRLLGEAAGQAVTDRAGRDAPSGARWVPLQDVATLGTGHTPDRKRPDYWGGDIPWVSLPEIRELDGRVCRGTKLTITQAGVDNSSAVVLPVGTVCFSRTASIGFVTTLGVPGATSQDFHNWTPGLDVQPAYLMHALRRSRQYLLNIADGSTHRTIYQRQAERFQILLLVRQRHFVISRPC